ncbi:MAG TPA: class I SAM-dependent methyltransferase [Candidatus Dietzia intestinipullorum]|nr:class I SAM-dependent methyltransferase [Candidatus Dietzia merdigallinarum]HJC28744.1 class I SAM-dependent methyltransferase [Candidatus Dietzia intestinipullorum]
MEIPDYLIDFHRTARRQGPGSDASTRRALDALPNAAGVGTILDLGCGTGRQTLVLAHETDAQITAVDILRPFLDELEARAAGEGVAERITTWEASMDDLGLDGCSFDLLWAEGSAYTVGVENALRLWRPLVAPGGAVVVSDLCWLTDSRPDEVDDYWAQGYPDITTINGRLRSFGPAGYECTAHFVLPPEGWTDEYYTPIRQRSADFLRAHGGDADVAAFLDSGLEEARLYDRFGDYYSYVYFVLRPRE